MMTKARHRFGLSPKAWLYLLVLIPGIPFVTASGLIVVYANIPWPLEKRVVLPPIDPQDEALTLLVHGKGDSPASWARDFAAELNATILPANQRAIAIDWQAHSTDLLRCSLNGRRIGHRLAEELLHYPQLQRVHLIGHSAGSFVVYGLCETLKERNPAIRVQTTYLDPVSIYGGVDWSFGTRNFGSCADISDAYIDTQDQVPGSNEALRHPHTFDVTAPLASRVLSSCRPGAAAPLLEPRPGDSRQLPSRAVHPALKRQGARRA